MTADLIIKNANVFMTYRQCFEKRDVAVAGEKFYCISPAISYPGVEERDGKGRYMLPGLVDIHFHGCAGHDFSDGTPEALQAIGAYELRQGVTSICPASMTLSEETLKTVCANAYSKSL